MIFAFSIMNNRCSMFDTVTHIHSVRLSCDECILCFKLTYAEEFVSVSLIQNIVSAKVKIILKILQHIALQSRDITLLLTNYEVHMAKYLNTNFDLWPK